MLLRDAIQLGIQHQQAGRLDQAEAIFRQILAKSPDIPEVMQLLAIVLHMRQQHQWALELLDQAIVLNPSAADCHVNRGAVLVAMGMHDQAIDAFNRALQLRPNYSQALLNLGQALLALNRVDEATATFQQLVQLEPTTSIVHGHLADAFSRQGRLAECIVEYRRAVQLDAKFAVGWNNLGIALHKQWQIDQALSCFQAAQRLQPEWSLPAYCIGNVLADQGLPEDAVAQYRLALARDPGSASIHSTVLYGMHYDPRMTLPQLAREHAEFNRRHAEHVGRSVFPYSNSRDPNRKLKIGYVSPDFYFHAECFFVIPLLESHDRSQVEVHCYASVRAADSTTDRIRQAADVWHDVVGMNDQDLAEKIRQDEIDILVDLTMHTYMNRALLFAAKPAPVQVAWLAYPGSTGLPAMDWRITDPILDPPLSDQSWSTEKPMRLADCWVCFNPLSDDPPVNDLPARSAGAVTFGSLNKLNKLNSQVLKLWARVLVANPDSRLMLLTYEGSHRRRVLDEFESLGVASNRLEMHSPCARADYLQLYHQIDIGLDPFPYCGITTTCDALWMGVPVLTLPCELPISRSGQSLLNNVGLAELVAKDADDFVRLAKALAGDVPRLTEMRGSMRQRMKASPLLDWPRFARNMETAYRTMWTTWCAG